MADDTNTTDPAPAPKPKNKGGRPRKIRPAAPDPQAIVAAPLKAAVSDEELVRAEVEAEIAEETRERDRKALKAKLRKELREAKGLSEQHINVTVDLAPYSDRILIDNVAYLQGLTYSVPVFRAQVMYEAMQRSWGHQSEIDGKSENFYRKARGHRVVPAGNGAAVVTTSQLLKA